MPRARRGLGRSSRWRAAARRSGGSVHSPRSAPSARRASPSVPLTQTSSPTRAPSRRSAWPAGTWPNTVTHRFSGPAVVSPPTSEQAWASARANRPPARAASQASSRARSGGSASASVQASGSAPQAARSLRLTASALWPRAAGSTSAKKWRPCTSMSVLTASCMPGAGCNRAQSSPMPRTTGFAIELVAVGAVWMRAMAGFLLKWRSMSSNSPMAACTRVQRVSALARSRTRATPSASRRTRPARRAAAFRKAIISGPLSRMSAAAPLPLRWNSGCHCTPSTKG